MAFDQATEELLTELQGISEKNRELHLQITELRKDRALWKESLQHAAEKDAVIEQLNLELNTLQWEVTRLTRSNEELQKKLDKEFEESQEAKLQWQEQEKALRKALLEERSKHKDLKDRLKFYTNVVSPNPTPENSDDESSEKRRKSETNAMHAQIAKLKLTISELHAAIAVRDKKIRRQEYDLKKQDAEIYELQTMMNRVMDELEKSQEDIMHAYSSGDDASDESFRYPSPRSPIEPVESIVVPQHFSHKRSQSEATLLTVTPSRRSRSRSVTHSKMPSVSESFSLLDELSKMESVSESTVETAPVEEAGPLRKKLSALGLSTEGNRRALKKRLHGYIKRREAVLMKETATADQKLKAVKELHAARA